MSQGTHEYRGLKASTWDLSRGDTSTWTDRAFYLDIVRRFGQPVLDIGCGTGRILLDFLTQGIDIDGVDNSPEMLQLCREKAARLGLKPALYEQNMESLDLPRRYKTILVPSSSLQLLTDIALARQAVSRFFAHLQSDGAFLTAFGFDWRPGEVLDKGWKLSFEKVRPEDGAIVRSLSHEWHEPEKQLWHEESRFEIELNGKVILSEHQTRSPAGRWYTQPQAIDLYRDAGFTDIQLFHGFSHEPATPDDRFFCALGIKRCMG